MSLWTLVKDFQSLIVGVVGFLGIIFTLWFNARQARRDREAELNQERETLRAALLEELKIVHASLERNKADRKEGKAAFVPTDPMDDAYKAFTQRIGLLTRSEVQKVMYAYLTLRTFEAKLFLIGTPVHTSDRHVQIPHENMSLFYSMEDSLVEPINDAIAAMENAQDVS